MAVNYRTRINAWLTWITLTTLMKPIKRDFARSFLGVGGGTPFAVKLMRLSYYQETLVPGCLAPAASSLLERPRQMPSAAHVQARGDPGQWHGCLGAQLPAII